MLNDKFAYARTGAFCLCFPALCYLGGRVNVDGALFQLRFIDHKTSKGGFIYILY
jgi:hypothetical protein